MLKPSTLAPLFAGNARWGVAVSGGGDSVALLSLLLEAGYGPQMMVLHYNHKWGPWGDEAEAFVRKLANAHGLACKVGHGQGRAATNAEEQARKARYAFFGPQVKAEELAGVLVGHTASDNAEGFIMRLARGSGLKGLCGMQENGEVVGVRVVRPLLGVSRAELRAYLKDRKQKWLDDPANNGDDTLRARIRKVMPQLAAAGVEEAHICASIASLARADAALDAVMEGLWPDMVYDGKEGVRLDRPLLLAQPEDVAQRVLAKVMQEGAKKGMPPRLSKRLALLEKIRTQAKGTATLGGIVWKWQAAHIACSVETIL